MYKPSDLLITRNRSPKERRRSWVAEILLTFLREPLIRWYAAVVISRERRVLRNLSDSALHDLGITREEADREAGRDYFDIPSERLRMYGLLDCSEMKQPTKRDS